MTVSGLINYLREFDAETEVVLQADDGGSSTNFVALDVALRAGNFARQNKRINKPKIMPSCRTRNTA